MLPQAILSSLALHDEHPPLPNIIDLCDDDDETNLLEPYIPHGSPLLFPSRIEDDAMANGGVKISPASIFAQITPIDELPQQPLVAMNVSSRSVTNEISFAESRMDTLKTRSDTFLRPPPPQYCFARRPVIVPLPVDNLDRLHESHDSDSCTSLPQCPPISLPRTPVTTGEPLTAVSMLKHAEDLPIALAAEELPPQYVSRTIDQTVDEDDDDWSLFAPQIPISLPSLVSVTTPINPTNETPPIDKELSNAPFADPFHNDLVTRNDSIRLEDPSQQSFSKACDFAPSQAFEPLPSLTVALPSPPPSRSIDHSFPVTLLSRLDVPTDRPFSSHTAALVRTWRLATTILVSPPAPSPPRTTAPAIAHPVTDFIFFVPKATYPCPPHSGPPSRSASRSTMLHSLGAVSVPTDLSGSTSASFPTLDPRPYAAFTPPPRCSLPLHSDLPSLVPVFCLPPLLHPASQSSLVVMEDNASKRGGENLAKTRFRLQVLLLQLTHSPSAQQPRK
ncbi:hypothetical protein EDB92DRAFT_1951061 [Lactarius akahatsu]|uniref:Uncharacterized protein n=1 Tax=Lactarius akahatsu TaxID=416441 RepID=A0AAD4Q9Y9_9AGAM|nr:hypothetical protein EDB92DRAFT_1951061 [Lactarius akahatsu]